MTQAMPTTTDRSRTKAVTSNSKPTSAQIAAALNSATYALELMRTADTLAKRTPPRSARDQARRSQYIIELLQVGTRL